jgi:hypothetical protein
MRKKILVFLMLILILVGMYGITYRVELKVPLVVFASPSSAYREVWVNVSVTNTHENMTTSGDIEVTVSSAEGVNIAWATMDWENQGYDTYMDWLNGTSTLPYHWGEMDWHVSEGSLTSITWDEIKYWWDMYSDTGGSVSYQTFMGNTYMADSNSSDPTNDPDIIGPEIPWNGNSITIKDLVVPANTTVHLVLKIVITEPGAYSFNLTSPNSLLEILPSSWRVGGVATILVPYDYSTIQAAIDAASPGDTIIVYDGTYPEDLSIPATKTDLEIRSEEGESVTIKGVQNVPVASWPLAIPNIEIDASGVKIHGFTIEGPDHTSGYYSSGIVIGASGVEIYDNSFKVTPADNLDEISQAIQTFHKNAMPGVDISGLNIHDNNFTHLGAGVAGYEGIYINLDEGTDVATVQHNNFNGNIVRAITTERSVTTIEGNVITTDLVPGLPGGYQGINVGGVNAGNVMNVSVTNNVVNGSASGRGFMYGIKLGFSSTSTFTNVAVTSNTIQMNEVGVFVKFSADGVKVNLNNIYGNTNYGVSNADSATLDAEYNWWGDEKGPGNEAATVDHPAMLTTDSHYDRNPSFFIADDGTWWLFFVRASDSLPHVPPTYNPDAATYDVWYMTSSNQGFTWSAETKISPTTSQRGMAAFQDDAGKIWVFVSSPGAATIQYYTTTDGGGTWTGPTATVYSGSHVDAFQASDGKIWVFYEGGTGVEAIQSSDYGSSWVQVTGIGPSPNDGIPKVTEAEGKLYVVWCNWAVGGKAWYTTSTDGLVGSSWNSPTQLVDVPGTIMCDPVLCKDGYGVFWLFYAPWDTVTDSQLIEYITSTDGGATWSSPTSVTTGGYGTTYWWDMWPEVAQVGYGGKMILFYGSESSADGTTRIDGNMWMMTVRTPGDFVSENVDFKPWLVQPYPPIVPVPELYVDPLLSQCWTGFNNTFQVRVMLTNVELLYGFDFKLTWDPLLLDLAYASYSELWGAYPSTYPWQDTIDNTLGEYHLALSGTGDATPFDGDAALATLTFDITSEPVYPINFTSDLALVDTLLTSAKNLTEPEPILHVVYDGAYMCNSTLPEIALGQSVYTIERTPYDPNTGETKKFDVNILVRDVVNLEAFDFNLTYDPYLLKFGNEWQIHVACANGWVVWNDTQGSVVGHADGISPLVNGTVTLATIKFKVSRGFVWNTVNRSRSCSLEFSYTNLARPGDVAIEHEAIDGAYRYKPVPGDLDMSGNVDILDLSAAAHAFGLTSSDPGWDVYWFANVYVDDTINILDIVIIARNFGRTDPEP